MSRIVFIGESELNISEKEFDRIEEAIRNGNVPRFVWLNDISVSREPVYVNLNNVLFVER